MAVSDAVRLKLYNGALRLLRERKLGSISENREPRRVLDDIWDDDALDTCLEMGQWHFASRTIEHSYDPDVTPAFGLQYAFTKPDDFIRLIGIWEDAFQKAPLLAYRENGPYWFADLDTIYLSYVSNDGAYGEDPTLWSDSFRKLVQAYLANEASRSLTTSQEIKDDVASVLKKRTLAAQSLTAQGQPTKFRPAGSWVRSRSGG